MLVAMATRTDSTSLLLLYDGACGLCARSVQWLLEHDRGPRRGPPLRFAPLQGETAAPLLARHGLTPAPGRGFDTLILVVDPGGPRERVLVRSAAVLRLARYLGPPWSALGRLAGLAPAPLLDAGYGVVARNRLRVFGTADACRLPRPGERARFLP
jgi:predicted DCC family thiol-disulfide oxidoreductase YuxK